MQAAKDTFLKTLASRLATVNPARTVLLNGMSRPAVIAVENETAMPANTFNPSKPTAGLPGTPLQETFLLHWEAASRALPEGNLMYVDCKLSYGSKGTSGMAGTDRGRILTAMDSELLCISEPCGAAKCDYTQNPPVALGTNIFWTRPVMSAPVDANGMLVREAMVRVFFFPEVG